MTPSEIVQRAREATGFGDAPTHDGRRDATPRRAARVPFALLIFGLVVGSLVLLLALNTASAANELRRHELTSKDAAIAARLQDLRVRVAASAAPGNVARAATELGMVPAGNPAFVVIGPDGKATVMGKPKAVTEAPIAVPKTKAPTHTASPSATPATTPATAPAARPTTAGPTAASPTRGTRTTPTPARTPPPQPTSTPTPVVTLPGGTR